MAEAFITEKLVFELPINQIDYEERSVTFKDTSPIRRLSDDILDSEIHMPLVTWKKLSEPKRIEVEVRAKP